jgi:hypothetical protein
VTFCCGSALEAQRSGTRAAPQQRKAAKKKKTHFKHLFTVELKRRNRQHFELVLPVFLEIAAVLLGAQQNHFNHEIAHCVQNIKM